MATPVLKKDTKTRRAWVVKSILNGIFTGMFQGGDHLVEEELAVTFGVSRTPVREAMADLAGIGVIGLKPNHGAVVRPFGPQQIREMYQIRSLLESEAARLAAGRIDPTALRHLRERTQALLQAPDRPRSWVTDAVVLDQQLHELISHSSGSERLSAEIGRYRVLVQSVREAVGNLEHAQDVAMVEHTRIIDALLEGSREAAAEAMISHIARGTEAAVCAMFPSSATPDGAAVTISTFKVTSARKRKRFEA
jgi:DNA-binding GntR family transcriptional regulator